MKADLSGQSIVLAGGSGFLGLSMAEAFAVAGAKLTILSRSVPKASGSWSHRVWSGRTLGDWTEALDGADAVVKANFRTSVVSLCGQVLSSAGTAVLVLEHLARLGCWLVWDLVVGSEAVLKECLGFTRRT